MTAWSSAGRRGWTGPPARPIRYGLWQRWADRRNGRRDASKGIPEVVVDEKAQIDAESTLPGADRYELVPASAAAMTPPAPVNTAYIGMLAGIFKQQAEEERIGYRERRGPLDSARQAKEKQLAELSELLAEHRRQLGAAGEPLDEAGRRVRRAVEIANDRPEYLSRRRRLSDHARELAKAEQRYLRTLTACQKLAAEIVDLHAQILAERHVAVARVRRACAHAERRIAGYWRYLVLHHQQGPALNTQLRPAGPQLPSWLDFDDADLEVNP
ncbi:hypothetical protein [Catellatospora sp. NPDC049609]|uniref:hypothetical protein n=1 Tax=Catellatospora sp. NPDC049609 TaxID=3155505 RepID=UPI0034233E30